MTGDRWQSQEVLAWTASEGPAHQPPAPPRWLQVSLGALLAATFAALVVTDSLCPEHRVWVQALAAVAFALIATAAVGLVRSWASTPMLTGAASIAGITIGTLDAAHNAARGTVLIVAFSAVTLISVWMVARQSRLSAWEQAVVSDLRPVADVRDLAAVDQRDSTPAARVDEASSAAT